MKQFFSAKYLLALCALLLAANLGLMLTRGNAQGSGATDVPLKKLMDNMDAKQPENEQVLSGLRKDVTAHRKEMLPLATELSAALRAQTFDQDALLQLNETITRKRADFSIAMVQKIAPLLSQVEAEKREAVFYSLTKNITRFPPVISTDVKPTPDKAEPPRKHVLPSHKAAKAPPKDAKDENEEE